MIFLSMTVLFLIWKLHRGTDIRHNWNLLAYSMVTYWYGMPDAKSNHRPMPDLVKRKLLSLTEIEWLQQMLKDGIISFIPENLGKLVRDPELIKDRRQN